MTGIEWVFLASAIASAGVGAYSSYQQGKAADEQAKYQSQTALLNAKAMGEESDYEATRIREKYRRLRGSQIASATKAGISIDGSTGDLMAETNVQEDLDVMSVLYKGKQAILGEKFKSDLFISQGKNARKEGKIGVASSLIGGVSDVTANWPTIQ